MNTPSKAEPARRSLVDRFLGTIEWLGNLLPHPVTLFALFALFTILLSGIGTWLDWSVADPRPEGVADRAKDGLVRVNSLLSSEGLRKISTNLVKTFTEFAPLGTVLVALLGVGLAEHSGLFSAAIRFLVFGARKELVTFAIVFAGVMSNAASEIGYVVLIPLGAAVYHSLGRHPLAGLAAAFAGVSGGYSANLVLGTVDPLLAGITTPAAQIWSKGYEVNAACNWYFMAASTGLISVIGTWVSVKIVEPRLGQLDVSRVDSEYQTTDALAQVTATEKRGLAIAFFSLFLFAVLLVYICFPPAEKPEGFLKWMQDNMPWFGALGLTEDPKKGPAFLSAVVAIIFLAFMIPGIAFGMVTGTIRSDKDVIKSMTKSMTSMGSYIVLVFFAAQFVKFFEWSNLGTIVAIQGAKLIRTLNLDNASVFAPFILICALVNLLMGSASAKWTFMAPIFVPMLMQIGYSPELTQCAYRIGDSCTNVISPMMSYFGIIFVLASKYDRKFGMGSIISLMFPYSVVFLICWTTFFYLWVFLLNMPIGPGVPLYFEAAAS
jgi:aminobenzoyl-glutamate transport protein